MIFRVKVTNFDNDEYFDAIQCIRSFTDYPIVTSPLDFECSFILETDSLQKIVNAVKFLSETYNNPEYEAIGG